MSDLDDKLREILQNLGSIETGDPSDDDWKIAQIKAAFDEDEQNQMRNWFKAQKGLMSGQAWFDKFKAELGEPKTFVGYGYDDVGYDEDDVLAAARRAAGLPTEEET